MWSDFMPVPRLQPPRDPIVRSGFAWRLRALRRVYGINRGQPNMTQKVFARELGVEDERYRRWERGEMEPSLGVLAALRRITGVSLDMLVCGERPGSPDMIPGYGGAATDTLLGDRLQWVRQLYFSEDIEAQSTEMNVDLAIWLRWEAGVDRPPIEKMEEFAHRYAVSLDYLYRGQMSGVRRELAEELLRLHPVLMPPLEHAEAGADVFGTGMAMGDDIESLRRCIGESQ
jgi:transcriptional regulator with XRE-family HTH domain